MSGLCSAVGNICIGDLLGASRNVKFVDCSIEDGKCGDWLIIWDLMTRFIHARKREVAILSRFTILDSVDHHGCVFGGSEFRRICMLCLQTDSLSSKPVANIVSVSIDERDTDGAV